MKRAVIIGAGPAGLTAAYELVTRTDIVPTVVETSGHIGGLARTVNYKGNRIDIGGHRFFSKSDRVTAWWLNHFPLEHPSLAGQTLTYQNSSRALPQWSPSSANGDEVMLVRPRKSRIYFRSKFFDYPIRISPRLVRDLGWTLTIKIALSYIHALVSPPHPIQTLEDFLVSRFGRELYETFFRSYTEKVWGVPCREISPEWGQQRISNLSVRKTLEHYVTKRIGDVIGRPTSNVSTSLIEQFMYPKRGPGQLWEAVARKIVGRGGTILTGCRAIEVHTNGAQVKATIAQRDGGELVELAGDYFFSTMAIPELIRAFDCAVPEETRVVSEGLRFRDFITVGLLLANLAPKTYGRSGELLRDNWLYLQDPIVKAGRVQIFNNWSPYMVSDPNNVWIGVEYFCSREDGIWRLADDELTRLAVKELAGIGLIDESTVLDATVIRMEKAYPAYYGTYGRFSEVRGFLDSFQNLFVIGRNGMHKYNNQDHSMLTAMVAVDNIISGITDKSNIWSVNAEPDHHEEKAAG